MTYIRRPIRRMPTRIAPPVESVRQEQTVVTTVQVVEEVLTTREAAALTKMSKSWFEKQRFVGIGPPYRKRGRSVRYIKSELLAWFTEFRESDFRGSS